MVQRANLQNPGPATLLAPSCALLDAGAFVKLHLVLIPPAASEHWLWVPASQATRAPDRNARHGCQNSERNVCARGQQNIGAGHWCRRWTMSLTHQLARALGVPRGDGCLPARLHARRFEGSCAGSCAGSSPLLERERDDRVYFSWNTLTSRFDSLRHTAIT